MGRLSDQILRCMIGACDDTCEYYCNGTCSNLELLKEVEEKLKLWKYYEDMEEQGRLIEVKHGRWKIIGMRPVGTHLTHYCSICGGHGDNEMDYCPNCGAKMESEVAE